jgi:hypothetical protein
MKNDRQNPVFVSGNKIKFYIFDNYLILIGNNDNCNFLF